LTKPRSLSGKGRLWQLTETVPCMLLRNLSDLPRPFMYIKPIVMAECAASDRY